MTGTTVDDGVDNRTWSQRLGDSGGRSGMRFDRGLTPKARAGIAAGVIGAVAMVGAAAGPYRSALFGGSSVMPDSVELVDGADEIIGFEAALAYDDDQNTALGLRWVDVPPPGDPTCGGSPAPVEFEVVPPADMTVKRLELVPGGFLGDEPADHPALYRRPTLLEISDGSLCERVELGLGDGFQKIDLADLGFVPSGSFKIGVLAVAGGANDQYPLVLIAEIRLDG